jgi:hypothetical protein
MVLDQVSCDVIGKNDVIGGATTLRMMTFSIMTLNMTINKM